MKKLTAGIFAGILTIVTVNAARADIATTNYVNQNVDAKVGTLTDLTTSDKGSAVAAINEVNKAAKDANTAAGKALTDAKTYADGLNGAMNTRVTATESAIETLNGTGEGSVKKQIDDKIKETSDNVIALTAGVAALETGLDYLTNEVENNKKETVVDKNGAYVTTTNTVAQNLTALDGQVKTNTDAIAGLTTGANSVDNKIKTAIDGLNGNVTGTGVVKTIKQENGVLTATLSKVAKADLDETLTTEIDGKMATTVYENATTMAADGTYAKKDNTVGVNLTELDKGVAAAKAAADSASAAAGNALTDAKEYADGLNSAMDTRVTANANAISNLTNNKANAADVYTKTEIDDQVSDINTEIGKKVTATNLQNKLLTTTAAGQLQDASTGLTKPTECGQGGVTCMLVNDGTGFKWEKIVNTYTADSAS